MKHTSFSIRFAPGPWCSLKQHIIPSNVLENIQSGKSSPLTFCSARDAGKSLPIWCKFHTPWLQHYERVDILPNSTIKNSNGAKWALNVFMGDIGKRLPWKQYMELIVFILKGYLIHNFYLFSTQNKIYHHWFWLANKFNDNDTQAITIAMLGAGLVI